MCYTGYDIEDAVILNRASLDRGFARAMLFRRYQTSLKRYVNECRDMIDADVPKVPAKTDR